MTSAGPPTALSAATTDQYWDVDGVPLASLAWNIVSWGETRQSPPPLRGSNLVVPYRPGSTWLPKQVDSKIITIGGYVIGSDSKGNVKLDQVQMFRDNWTTLRRLLWRPYDQLSLTRRWREPGSTVVSKATALAQFHQGLEPMTTGPNRATFTVDLMLADPFFYGDEVPNYVANLARTAIITNLGDMESVKETMQLVGPLTSPILSTQSAGHLLAYDGTIPAGSTVTVDVSNWTATLYNGVTTVSALGALVPSSPTQLFGLGPFSDVVSLSTQNAADTGYVLISVQPTWS